MLTGFSERTAFADKRVPLVLEPATANADLVELVSAQKEALAAKLLSHGALLFRGFGITEVERFDEVVTAVSESRIHYTNRSTPRSTLGDRIYSATEYPPDREIVLHNENAYQTDWPTRVVFGCLIPAASGGETPIADMRDVTAAIGAELLDSFESRGVAYKRHYHPNVDLSWQDVFQTADVEDVARYCDTHQIAHEWIDSTILRTIHIAQGTARHPLSGERVFFNQAHLFHVSSLGDEVAELVLETFGRDLLPRHATYGDGTEIDATDLTLVRDAFSSAAVSFPWKTGDVLLVDNMQVAHGRRPFTGKRKVVVALCDAYSDVSRARGDLGCAV